MCCYRRCFPLLAVFSLWQFVFPDQVGLVILIVVFLLVTACGWCCVGLPVGCVVCWVGLPVVGVVCCVGLRVVCVVCCVGLPVVCVVCCVGLAVVCVVNYGVWLWFVL